MQHSINMSVNLIVFMKWLRIWKLTIYFMSRCVPIKQKETILIQFAAGVFLTPEVSAVCERTG